MGRREKPPSIPADGQVRIGDAIRALRWSKGLTLRQLAAASSCSASHLSHVETGSERPSDSLLHDLSHVLGTTYSELVGATARDVNDWVEAGVSRRLPSSATASKRRIGGIRGAGFRIPRPGKGADRGLVSLAKLLELQTRVRAIEQETQDLKQLVDALLEDSGD